MSNMVILPGGKKVPVRGARVVGEVDPEHLMSVTAVLRPKAGFNVEAHLASGAEPMSREEFAALHGADSDDVAHVAAYAGEQHLTVSDVNVGGRTMVLTGRTGDMENAFGVDFKMYVTPDNQRYRGREGDIYVPAELDGVITAVLGLDDRAAAAPHFRRAARADAPRIPIAAKAAAATKTFNAPEIAALYGFPPHLTGGGQCVGIIELGGGFRQSDMKAYFGPLGLKVPKIISIGVDGGGNHPGVDLNADGEVTLDIQVCGAVAPKATMAVYFAPNKFSTFLDAIKTAIHDTVHKPSVISISWGGPEFAFTDQAKTEFDAAFQEAAAVGVTVLVASGDNGSSDESHVTDNDPHVDFPSASPFVLSCGGTRVVATDATTIAKETVWNDGPTGPGAGGGGVSRFFPRPPYQNAAGVPPEKTTSFAGRGVPDVSGNADPVTGYNVVVGGQHEAIGGTSAVAPLYAGLVALLNEARATASAKPAGFVNPQLYATAGVCRDVTEGNNDYSGELAVYEARAGWD
ncbi:MAG TPA: S53 family peptidase, partial [Thermoanaerobaculia bacterium]|nr:S53 family peptidase [Thermoanaerobaculia bacterium]